MRKFDLHWFCTGTQKTAKGVEVRAHLLSEIAVDGLRSLEVVNGFLYGHGPPAAITAFTLTTNEFASAQDVNGAPIVLFDGDSNSADLQAAVMAAAQNQLVLRIASDRQISSGPFFLSTSDNLNVSRYSISFELFCKFADSLPDLKANVQALRVFEDLLAQGWEAPSQRYSDDVAIAATQLPVGPGFILPLSLTERQHCAALEICGKAEGYANLYSGNLYLIHSAAIPSSGAILGRHISVSENNDMPSYEAVIGRIQEIYPVLAQ